MYQRNSQTGVALITVLLIVALMVSIATAMLSRLIKDMRRAEYNSNQGQLIHFMYGVESWAIGRLKLDRLNDKAQGKVDHNKDVWHDKIKLEIVDNAANISAVLRDVQGKFNLNNLIKASIASDKQNLRFNAQVKIFNRLLQTLEINTNISDSIIDWLDKDNQVRFPQGAEDNVYMQQARAYRTANTALVSFAELNLIKGITPEIMNKLKKHITILPMNSKINVNTASKEVLIALSSLLNSAAAENIIETRKQKPFKTTQEFLDLMKKETKKKKLEPANLAELISVSSDYFECKSKMIMLNAKMISTSLINRSKNKISVIQRQRGIF